MEFVHRFAAGLLMVAIDILGYDDHIRFPGQIHQGVVGGVRLAFGDELPAPVVPAPDHFGVGHEGPMGG